MPELIWKGKEQVMNHHLEVPVRCLDRRFTYNAEESGNRIIHGDNLEALKALLPEYEGRVKCIYIDPPYNTGNESWVYNDNVKDPRIVRWLGEVVGKEGEDFCRHDKWLCMMYPRLQLLKRLLASDGSIWISIDDNEVGYLKILMDEIFGRSKRLASLVWRTDGNFDNQAKIKNCHEYILVYAKNPERFKHPNVVDPSVAQKSKLNRAYIRNTIVKNGPKNPVSTVILPVGFPADFGNGHIKARSDVWPHYEKDVLVKDGKLVNAAQAKTGWSSKQFLLNFINNNFHPIKDTKGQLTKFVLTSTGAIESIKERKQASHVISVISGVGSTQAQSSDLEEMGIVKFPFPKPVDLLTYLISVINDKNALILDSFAGSGTTAHAVLNLNKKDNGNRKFILIEMMDYAETITAERVRRVIDGYGADNKAVPGTGGDFSYYTLGERIFDDEDNLNESIGIAKIRDYVARTEQLPGAEQGEHPAWLGEKDRMGYYFHYLPDQVTFLNMDFLATLTRKNDAYLIYADVCLLDSDFMHRHCIRFKKIPRDISRF
ncbi:MAG: site-specific DNA-methyltransferase [Candidatus Electrothrix gigas]